ncbi:hypothetical protein BKA64DRAFT_412178 [Cadophora sp. MPI-SDFR-AT-0126]|nr:hypothetical protein BKA64DRAFT_412178 [Leotiomycetes sp. MPI-SDFR-AT-0126]
MDPLSIAASTFAIVQIADRIITLCKLYISGVRDAPAELSLIASEVGSVKCVLEILELQPADGTNTSQPILNKLQDPLKRCHDAFVALEALFPSESDSPAQGKRQRLSKSLAALAWPFKRDRATKLIEQIGRYKATIVLGLTVDSAQDVKQIWHQVNSIQTASQAFHFDKVLKWLVTTDPSPNHNRACELHEEHTGQWLTRSPEYINWKTLTTRALWVHGIPGAGKTVLFSYIVENIRSCCTTDSTDQFAHAYYYCDFSRDQDETEHLLRWIINQLSRQLKDLTADLDHLAQDGGQPSLPRLSSVLCTLVQRFSRVFILIDALDEAKDRERLLNFLVKALDNERFENIQLLVASRKEVDIERALSPKFESISLSNPYVDEDIRTYVHSSLRGDLKLNRLPELLKIEVATALVRGAQGMFRWVFCQIDCLKRLNTEPEVRAALYQLPETLDETYERILGSIPTKNQQMARTVLHILSSNVINTLDALLDALSVDLDSQSYSPANRPWDPMAPIEICRCLISYTPENDIIRLAHYTVKEFLTSQRIISGPAHLFQVSDDSTNFLEASIYLIYVRDLADLPPLSPPPELLNALAGQWASITREVQTESTIQSLIIQLLDPSRLHRMIDKMLWTWEESFPVWTAESSHAPKLMLMLTYLGYMDFYETTVIVLDDISHPIDFTPTITAHLPYSLLAQFLISSELWSPTDSRGRARNRSNRNGTEMFGFECTFENYVNDAYLAMGMDATTLLHITVGFHNERFLRLFVSRGADVNLMSPNGFSVLAAAIYAGYGGQFLTEKSQFSSNRTDDVLPITKILLRELGADPSSKSASMTPLQLTALLFSKKPEIYFEVARELLDCGADPNGVAQDTINQTRIRSCTRVLSDFFKDGSKFYRPECRPIKWLPALSVLTETTLERRGPSKYYDTPLRILENSQSSHGNQNLRRQFKELLKSYGAKSLHLFPIPDQPGYCEEDMKSWQGMQGMGEKDAAPLKESQNSALERAVPAADV